MSADPMPDQLRDNAQLGPHHVDALTQATRAANNTNAMAEIARARDHREAMAKAERTHILLERVAVLLEQVITNTAALPALVDMQVPAKTNGHGTDKETQDHG